MMSLDVRRRARHHGARVRRRNDRRAHDKVGGARSALGTTTRSRLHARSASLVPALEELSR